MRAQQKLLVHSGRIIGVGLSPELYLVARPRLGTTDNVAVVEQMVGFLHAQGAAIVRVSLRCPLRRFLGRRGYPVVLWRQCLVYWVRSFLAQGYRTCGLGLPFNVLVSDSARTALRAGASYWSEVAMMVRALKQTETELLLEISPDLFRIAKWWEFQTLKLLWRSKLEGDEMTRDAIELVAACDRHWKNCAWLFPSYEPLAETTARLL